jgi:hypothetical protein
VTRCFIAELAKRSHEVAIQEPGPCEGRLVHAHLLPKQKIRQRFPKGAVKIEGLWRPTVVARELLAADVDAPRRTLTSMLNDPRLTVPTCGGLVGIGAHHGMLDNLQLRIPRNLLPPELEEYAEETGLAWWLDRAYGPRREAA